MKWEGLGDINLLIVEDDPFNMELATTIFQEISSINIFRAYNGQEALKILQQEDISMMILDIHMPILNGFDTLKATRKQLKYNFIPVVVVTGEEVEMEKSYELGADDFVSKPYNPVELKSRVFTHLKKSKYREKFYNLNQSMEKEIALKNKQLLQSMADLESIQKKLFYRMGQIVDFKKNFGNNKRVAVISKQFALRLGLSKEEADNIFYAAMIRNWGLLALPDEIANQNERLMQRDRRMVEKFILSGSKLLKDVAQTEFLKVVDSVLTQYKENYDGSGYPNKLKDNQISQYATIVAIAETFDALLSSRKYRYKNKFTANETKTILKTNSGRRFKPNIIKVFLNNYNEFIITREGLVRREMKKQEKNKKG